MRQIAADIVTLYVGWNDIYSINPFRPNDPEFYEVMSANHVAPPVMDISAKIARWLNNVYVAQYLRRLIYLELPRLVAKEKPKSKTDTEVDPRMANDYRARLIKLVNLIRSDDAVPVLMTLPSVLSPSMSQDTRSIVHYPSWAGGNPMLLLKVVRQFNETIREIAREEEVVLIDNAAYFNSLEDKESLFFDTLHMYCKGYSLVARNIEKELLTQGLIH